MKKLFLTIALAVAAAFGANAQVGISAGYSHDVWSVGLFDDMGYYFRSQGFHVGINYSLPVLGNLKFAPGITFTSVSEDKVMGENISGTISYVSVPLNLEASQEIFSGINAFVFAGPGLRYMLSAKADVGGEDWDLYEDSTGGTHFLDNRFDVTLGFGFGLEMAGIRAFAGFNGGLLDLASKDMKDTIEDFSVHGKSFQFGLGYVYNF